MLEARDDDAAEPVDVASVYKPVCQAPPHPSVIIAQHHPHALQASPSVSLTELHASVQADNPDFERLMSGFRQQLHVQTLQEKLQKDNDQLEQAISHLKQQVQVQVCFDDDDQLDAVIEEERVQWQRKLEKFQSEFRALSLENLELKRVVSQQQVRTPPPLAPMPSHCTFHLIVPQARLNGQQVNSIHRAEVDQQLQSQLQQEKITLQRQVASFQQQFRELSDHSAVNVPELPKGASSPNSSPSFTKIRSALDAAVSARKAREQDTDKLQQERAEWQRRLDAAEADARSSLLANEELKRSVCDWKHAADIQEARAIASEAAAKQLSERSVEDREQLDQWQRRIDAFSSETRPVVLESMALKQAVVELQAAVQLEQGRAAEADACCKRLEMQCSQLEAVGAITKQNIVELKRLVAELRQTAHASESRANAAESAVRELAVLRMQDREHIARLQHEAVLLAASTAAANATITLGASAAGNGLAPSPAAETCDCETQCDTVLDDAAAAEVLLTQQPQPSSVILVAPISFGVEAEFSAASRPVQQANSGHGCSTSRHEMHILSESQFNDASAVDRLLQASASFVADIPLPDAASLRCRPRTPASPLPKLSHPRKRPSARRELQKCP